MEQDGDYENVFKQFQNYRRDNILCDVIIVIEKEQFPVHKVLLSSTSLYFKLLFTGEMKEKIQGEISIKGVTEPAVSNCLKFIYCEKFDIKMDEVSDLLHAACLFQLERLKQKCMEIIQSNIDVSNCVQIYQLIQAYDCKEVEIKTQTMILQNADKLLQDDKVISDFDADTLTMMVKSEDLSVSDESVIFEALVKWIASDEEQRKDGFCEMLEFIRLPVMDGCYFADVVWFNDHIHNKCKTCKKYFTESARWKLGGKHIKLKEDQMKIRNRREDVISDNASVQTSSGEEEIYGEATTTKSVVGEDAGEMEVNTGERTQYRRKPWLKKDFLNSEILDREARLTYTAAKEECVSGEIKEVKIDISSKAILTKHNLMKGRRWKRVTRRTEPKKCNMQV